MSKYILPTYTGLQFDLLEPTMDMICIEDIAHHLAIENRFNGSTKFPYSVGYHSILVSRQCPSGLELEGLLHDAAEAYCKDLPSPLKKVMYANLGEAGQFNKYMKIENHIQSAINIRFGIKEYSLIKTVDLRMATTEIKQLLVNFPEENWAHDYVTAEPYDNVNIMNLSFDNVERLFLEAYNKWRRD